MANAPRKTRVLIENVDFKNKTKSFVGYVGLVSLDRHLVSAYGYTEAMANLAMRNICTHGSIYIDDNICASTAA